MKYRTTQKRKEGKPFMVLLTIDEHEYLERIIKDRGGNMALYMRGKAFARGWRRELDDLRREQGPMEPKSILARTPNVS